jgi:hypothetical protein
MACTTLRAVILGVGLAAIAVPLQGQAQEDRTQDRVAFPAHKIIGNVHYVGTVTTR